MPTKIVKNAISSDVNFSLNHVYLKDMSMKRLLVDNKTLKTKERPKSSFSIAVNNKKLGNDLYEIVLWATTAIKLNDKPIFLAKAAQAGIFKLKGFTEHQLSYMLGSYCPSLLFPSARKTMCDIVRCGGFPAIPINSINFDSAFQRSKEKARQQAEVKKQKTTKKK